MTRIAVGLTVLLAGVLLVAALPVLAVGQPPGRPSDQPFTAGIPSRAAGLYFTAVNKHCPELSWTVLAAVGHVESGHAAGREIGADGTVAPPIIGPALDGSDGVRVILDTDDGRLDGDSTWDHAVGPMQFIPGTWRRAGLDASGDGLADPHNLADAIHTAAAHLCSLDAGHSLTRALRAYNNSDEYVQQVLATAHRYQRLYAQGAPDADAILAHPNVTLTPQAARDIEAGIVDPRVLQLLSAMAERTQIGVSVIKTGHSKYVAGTDRISHHWYGRAVDVWRVGDKPVTRDNSVARGLVRWTIGRHEPVRPHEIGQPWPDFTAAGVFTDSMHRDHLHFAYDKSK